MPARSYLASLDDIIDSIETLKASVKPEDFEKLKDDRFFRFGVERAIEIISEASRRIPESAKLKYPEIPWPNIKAIGNIIRHEYESVEPEILWDVLSCHLDPLAKAVRQMKRDVITNKP